MTGAAIRRRLEIDNPHVSDEELERAALVVRKYITLRQNRADYWMDREQWEVEGDMALVIAARTFEPGFRVRFATHAGNWARWLVGHSLRHMMPVSLAATRYAKKLRKRGQEPGETFLPPLSIDAEPDVQDHLLSLAVNDGDSEDESAEQLAQIGAHLHLLSDIQRRHLAEYVRLGNARLAAEECGVSRSAVFASLERIRKKLRPLVMEG